jgi:beta-galactosidase
MVRKYEGNEREQLFSLDWQFHFGDLTPEMISRGEGDWSPVDLPHDWCMDYPAAEEDPLTRAMNWRFGVGMYKKEFILGDKVNGKSITLHFEGAYQDSSVWLNGHFLGNHFYGYTPFEYDITPYIKFGEPNLVIVRVDNSEQPNSRWYSGSGITRDVWLRVTDKVHVASFGTYITTDSIDNGAAELTIRTEIDNDGSEDAQVQLITRVCDQEGKLWAQVEDEIKIGAACKGVTIKQNVTIKDPILWSAGNPYLYDVFSIVVNNGTVVDTYKTPIGIRTIKFDPERGFIINNVREKINGMAIHHDAGALGAAVPVKVWERRLRKLKECGVNGIRTAHNPCDPQLMDLMDRMGFYVMDEFFDEWTHVKDSKARSQPGIVSHGYAERFDKLYAADAESIMRRDRNHPCVVIWSVGNEVEEVYDVNGYEIMRKLRELCHRIDPTRPVTQGTNMLAKNSEYTYEAFLAEQDLKGFNWINLWKDRAELFHEPDKIKHPDWSMLVTETGVLNGSRGGYQVIPRRSGEQRNHWRRPYYSIPVEASKYIRFIETRDYIAGAYYWTGVSYMGEAMYPRRGSDGAIVDLSGFITDAFYFYKSIWKRNEPIVHILPHWNMDVEPGTIIPVLCYTSCATAELFLNGKSYGEKAYLYPAKGIDYWPNFDLTKPYANTDDLFLAWDVPYEPGVIEAVGYDREGNEIARHTIRTVGKPVKICAQADTKTLKADRRDLAHIEISLLDGDGNLSILAKEELTVTVTGAGRLKAMDNGNPLDHTLGSSSKRCTHYGLLCAYVQAADYPGKLNITIEGKGLEKAELTIDVIK